MNFKIPLALVVCLAFVQDTKPYGNPIPEHFGEMV